VPDCLSGYTSELNLRSPDRLFLRDETELTSKNSRIFREFSSQSALSLGIKFTTVELAVLTETRVFWRHDITA
jgi:hypothetical protein